MRILSTAPAAFGLLVVVFVAVMVVRAATFVALNGIGI